MCELHADTLVIGMQCNMVFHVLLANKLGCDPFDSLACRSCFCWLMPWSVRLARHRGSVSL